MAKFTRIDVVLKMHEAGIVPIFYHKDREVCRNVLKSCYEAGIRVFEFTNRGDFAHEIFNELNKMTEAVEQMGTIDALVNNAAVFGPLSAPGI